MLVEDACLIADRLACPACRGPLAVDHDRMRCTAPECSQNAEPFASLGGKPVLIDFERSYIDRAAIIETGGASPLDRRERSPLVSRILHGCNHASPHFAQRLIESLARDRVDPTILVIGGGRVGSGADALYQDQRVRVIALDVYASPLVTVVADGHRLPFADGSIDAVWVQAVLEHTLDPMAIVAEMHRVLRPDGLVFANVAFMWPIVEQNYDFTRYTASGLRWLFRDFDVEAMGFSSGPGTGVVNAVRYLAQSLFRNEKLGSLATLPFLWLRWLDRFCGNRRGMDAAPAPFFYGRRRECGITPRQLIAFYDEQPDLIRAAHRLRS